MKILPRQTQLPKTPTKRRHQPTPVNTYNLHRKCLRWDFGFSCAFCLLHEADVSGGLGEAGKGLMWIEHLVTQSADSDQAGDYCNLLYSCKFCNRSRWAKRAVLDEKRLLDPTVETWDQHFKLGAGFSLELVKGASADAVYTHESYDLDDDRKVKLRALRFKVISKCLDRLTAGPASIDKFLKLSRKHDGEDRLFLLDAARKARQEMVDARKTLTGYTGEPGDSDASCRCNSTQHHSLPEFLREQLLAA